MKTIFFIFILTLTGGVPQQRTRHKPETPHLEFVTEYIRELAAIENIRAAGEKELQEGTRDQVPQNAVHTSTLIQLELRSQVLRLRGMHLTAPFDGLISNITVFYEQKIALHQKLIDISSEFISGPKPGVDYGKLAAELPKVRAGLDYIDHSMFDAVPLVFATLIDPKPDSKNHASHLVVTKAERQKLIEDLTTNFGAKLDQKDQNFTVSSATVLRGYLLKDYKCADDPWD